MSTNCFFAKPFERRHTNLFPRTHPIGYMANPALAYIPNLKHWYAYQIVYPLSLALVKASFLALYHRVFPPPNMNRVLFWGVSVFIAVYTVIIILVNVSRARLLPNCESYSSLKSSGFRVSKEPFRCMEGVVPEEQSRL